MSDLVDYGIIQEQSDIRAHVGPLAHTIWVYRTEEMIAIVKTGKYKLKTGGQPGANGVTFAGWPVPFSDVPGLRPVLWKSCPLWPDFGHAQHAINTARKGELACEIVQRLIRMGRFPLWVYAEEQQDRNMQIDGTDILVAGKWRIQTKCDWLAASIQEGGRGNLFVQYQERNPNGIH